MINPDLLVDGILRGVLGGRRKKSKKALKYLGRGSRGMMSNPNAMLTVAGVAWGIFETLQNRGAAGPGPVPSPQSAVPTPPLPNVAGEAAAVPPDALRIVRLAIAAAHADGTLSDDDREGILQQAKTAGAEHLMEQELARRPPLAQIVAGITDPAQRATLYVLAFGIIRADESVSGAERIFLAQLAHQLGLDPETVKKLEADAAARIDSQDGI